ncbi:MAG: hypothetical protein ACAI34_03425, partial [Verrucomicrobium sp.]
MPGYAYAMDFDEAQPWQTTLLQTPQFNGKPLPPSYTGKTAEEIEHAAPQVSIDFGGLFEGITWTQLQNFSSSGGGSGGSEVTKSSGTAGTWDAYASSDKVFYGDGIAQTRFKASANFTFALGSKHRSQEYAITVNANQASIAENSVLKGVTVPYIETDVFSIHRIGVLVRYLKNGEVIYTSTAPSLGKLYVNIFGASSGQLALGARYQGVVKPDADNDGMEDVWEQVYVLQNPTDEITAVSQFTPGGDYDSDGVSNLQEYLDGTDAGSIVSKALPVTWVSHVNTASQGALGGLTKTAGAASTYDADAIGQIAIIGNGRVNFRAGAGSHVLLGFNITNTSRDYADLNYAWHPKNSGVLSIYEGSTYVTDVGTWTPSTLLGLERVGDTISYLKDNVVVYTSTVKTRQPLIVDAAFYFVGSQVTEARYVTGDNDGDGMPDSWERAQMVTGPGTPDVQTYLPTGDPDGDGVNNLQELLDGTDPGSFFSKMESVVWTSIRNAVTVGTNGGLRKSSNGADWGADALASKKMVGDVEVQFVPGTTGQYMAVGFNSNNEGSSYSDLSYAIRLIGSGQYVIMENNVQVPSLVGTHTSDTTFRIARVGDTVRYYADGVLVYTSAVKNPAVLYVDCSIYNLNDAFIQCRYATGDSDTDGMSDVWELAQLPSGSGAVAVQAYLPTDDADGDGVNNLQEFLDGTDPRNIGSRLEPVIWTSLRNTITVGANGGLKKNAGGADWGGDALANQQIAGDGSVEFVPGSTGQSMAVGLNVNNEGASYTDLNFAIRLISAGQFVIVENNVQVPSFVGTHGSNTRFRISRVGDTVRYYADSALVYTSAIKSTAVLYVDCSIYNLNDTFTQCRYSTGDADSDGMSDVWELAQLPAGSGAAAVLAFLPTDDFDNDGVDNLQEFREGTNPKDPLDLTEPVVWTAHVNTTSQGSNGGLKKTAGGNSTWNADSVSTRKILGDGRIIFKAVAGSHFLLGFNGENTSRAWDDLDYELHPCFDGALYLHEYGVQKANFGTYNASTVFSIERVGSTVRYFKDGQVIYVSSTPSFGPLFVDTAFYNQGSEVAECRMVTGDLDGDGMSDAWELAQLPPGSGLTDVQNYLPAADADGDGVNNLLEFQDGTNPASNLSKAEYVTWTGHRNLSNANATGGLSKVSGTNGNWDADAISNKRIISDGWVETV